MPINQSVWKISKGIEKISEVKLASEVELEDVLQNKIEILDENWLIIGRQVLTKYNKYIDLLAIDANGSLIILELKKDKTPREVVAQGIDYASWIKEIQSDDISNIYESFCSKYLNNKRSLDDVFYEKFRIKLEEDNINNTHQIIVIATELDSSTERIIRYLDESNVPINVVFFKIFSINDEKYISRAWLIDPLDTSEIAISTKSKEPWNGDFYVSFGDGEVRSWKDAVKYGFVSGGGGAWYSRTLNQLEIGNRIWVNVPQNGYVGVGKVIDTARKADEVILIDNGKEGSIYELSKNAEYHKQHIQDEDKAEYIVRVEWIKTVTLEQAVKEVGFFGNQNTVCKPSVGKWTHTVDRLKDLWKIV
jgi:hypothetical protein